MVESEKAPPEILSDAYTGLQKATADGDHQKVYECTKEIIKYGDAEKVKQATSAHIVSLIRLRRLDDAFQFVNGNNKRRQEYQMELAYIQHRRNQNQKALEILEKIPQGSRDSQYNRLMAQVTYKLGLL